MKKSTIPQSRGRKHYAMAKWLMERAVEEDNKHQYEKALKIYELAISFSTSAMKHGGYNEEKINTIREKFVKYVNRAEELREYLERKKEERTHEDEDDDSEEENEEKNANRKRKFLCCFN